MSIIIPSDPCEDYETPRSVFDPLNAEFEFDLDAAASATNALCPYYLTKKDDALSNRSKEEGWPGERIWLNPPYGKQLKFFVAAAFWQAFARYKLVVLLIPSHTAEGWFHDYVWVNGVEIRFIRGRLRFRLPDCRTTSARFGSMIVVMDGRRK